MGLRLCRNTGDCSTAFPVEVIKFDDTVVQLVPLTTDQSAVSNAIHQFFSGPIPAHRTRIFDALRFALKSLSQKSPGDVIYAITDGSDNTSLQAEQIKTQLIGSGTRLFAQVILRSTFERTTEEKYGTEAFHFLIEHTGGAYFDWYANSREPKLSAKELLTIRQNTRWLVQNMLDDYDVTLLSPRPLPSKVRVKFRVRVIELNDQDASKFHVITQPVIATACP